MEGDLIEGEQDLLSKIGRPSQVEKSLTGFGRSYFSLAQLSPSLSEKFTLNMFCLNTSSSSSLYFLCTMLQHSGKKIKPFLATSLVRSSTSCH